MCDLCEESDDGSMQSCQDCGRLICFDVKCADDIIAPAALSLSGDLFCINCALQHDKAEEDADDYAEFGVDEWYEEESEVD